MMLKADQLAVAMVLLDDEELFIVGMKTDIRRLSDAKLLERVWEIKLDNGHRPYASLKKWVDYDLEEEPGGGRENAITTRLSADTGLRFAHDLHLVADTYLFRPTPAFWADLWVDFAAGPGLPPDRNFAEYYAVYRGAVLANGGSVKFVRL